jgi:hypothetical protein
MTSHLARLAARAAGQGSGLRPRAVSQFEQAANQISAEEYVAPRDPTSPGPDLAVPPPDANVAISSPEPAPDREEPRPVTSPPTWDSPIEPATPDLPIVRRPARGEALRSSSPRPTPEPSLGEVPTTGRPAPFHPPVEVPEDRPVRGPTLTEADSAGRPAREITPLAGAARPRPDLHASDAEEAVALRRQDAPQAPTQQVAHRDVRTQRAPQPTASQPATLPRLQPAARAGQGQTPEVTVNIGRIEVLTPHTPESRRPSVTSTPRRPEGAPDLADYLRDKGRR